MGIGGAFSGGNELFTESNQRLGSIRERKKFASGGVPLSQSEAAGFGEAELRVRAQETSERLRDARQAANQKLTIEETQRSNLANEAFQNRQLAQNQNQFNTNAQEARKARKASEPGFFDQAQKVANLAKSSPAVFNVARSVFGFFKGLFTP